MVNQFEIWNMMKKNKRWLTSKEILELFNMDYKSGTNRNIIYTKLSKLAKFKFIEKKKMMHKEEKGKKDNGGWGHKYKYRVI